MDAFAHRQVHRAVFISDLHLGARGCQAELLLDFLPTRRVPHAVSRGRRGGRMAAEVKLALAAQP